ncbi:MAG: SRPBCC domain-containing protein [Gemmatimonadetes bacterium]|nr:SRPBCC domain-containing protein [Gemmatimonadota bacterium]
MTESRDTRAIELSIVIDAPVEAVWKAIAEADELVNWFPMEAELDPRAGGRLWVSWGEGVEWSSRIEVWEPYRRQRSVVDVPEGMAPPEDAGSQPVRVAVEYTLEGRGGQTVLRLVHSGFSAAAEWDEFFDATRAGWTYFLRHLKHYIERHRSVARRLIRWRRPFTVASAEMWRMLGDPAALGFGSMRDGAWAAPAMTGGGPAGEVWLVREPYTFAGTIPALGDAVLFVEMEPGVDQRHCGVWLSTYGVDESRCAELQQMVDRTLGALPVDAGPRAAG